ncbi:hypothetical protein C3477_06770 [Mycobacterium kansasii]|nr:hypothetical protein C3B43_06500 [Mycobacterium kansasii]POY07662.1 hypothetical protein C3477_06770 [Mycobacterium kansasii]POY22661.1 hypothetical protein C3476_10445 [Mycobacterium kansasii]
MRRRGLFMVSGGGYVGLLGVSARFLGAPVGGVCVVLSDRLPAEEFIATVPKLSYPFGCLCCPLTGAVAVTHRPTVILSVVIGS